MTPLTIVIPTTGARDLTPLLRSLARQKDAGPVTAYVVCNPGNAGLKRSLPDGVSYLECDRGVNRARNAGWAAAAPGWVYFLDDDTLLPDDGHLRNVSSFLGSTAADAAGGPYLLPQGSSRCARVYHRLQDHWFRTGYRNETQWSNLLGGNLMLRKRAGQAPPFDGSLIFGGTETELLARWETEGRVMERAPDLGVWHGPELSWRAFAEKLFRQGLASGLIARRFPGREGYFFAPPAGTSRVERLSLALGRRIFVCGALSYAEKPDLEFSWRRLLGAFARSRPSHWPSWKTIRYWAYVDAEWLAARAKR